MIKRVRNVELQQNLDFYTEVANDSTLSKKSQPMPVSDRKFQHKLDSGRYNDFTHLDWKKYFQHMYLKATGHKCILNGYSTNVKTKSIITGLMNDYSAQDIKNIIDFLFLADHDLVENKMEITIQFLTRGWVMSVHPKAILWTQGKYKKRQKYSKTPPRTREWTGSTSSTELDNEIF